MLKALLASILSVLLVACPAMASTEGEQNAGEVKALIPEALRNTKPLAVRDTLQWDDLLQTNAKGRLRATLVDGSILSLGSSSQLRVLQHDAAAQQTAIDLTYGKLRNQVVKITQPGGKYEVKTPNALIGVIGTDFFVSYENNRTTVICYEGMLSVTPAQGAKVVHSNNNTTGSTSAVSIAAGQMVVIGFKIEGSELKSYSQMQHISKKATIVESGHRIRVATILGMVAVAGLTVALTQINSSSKPCGCR